MTTPDDHDPGPEPDGPDDFEQRRRDLFQVLWPTMMFHGVAPIAVVRDASGTLPLVGVVVTTRAPQEALWIDAAPVIAATLRSVADQFDGGVHIPDVPPHEWFEPPAGDA